MTRNSPRLSTARFFAGSFSFGAISGEWRSQPLTRRITDVLIALLVIGLPFVMGGREAWGHRVVITLALALGTVWCVHRVREGGGLVLSGLEPLLIAGLLLVWFQTRPLEQSTLARLSGEYQRLLTGWGEAQPHGEGPPPVWSSASLVPTETQHALWMLLAYGLIGVVVMQRLESAADCGRLLKCIAVSGVLMAAFAVAQLMMSNDRFFWVYRQPYTGTSGVLKGAFTNRNHFAQFLALSVGPLVWWMLAGRTSSAGPDVMQRKGLGPAEGSHSRFDRLADSQLLLLLCATGGVLLCIMLCLSRGGMLAAGLACAISLGVLWRSGKVRASLVVILPALGVIAMGGLIVFGQDQVEERVSQLASGNADRIDQSGARRVIWKADLAAIQKFPLLGTGVGSHRFVYPVYMEELADFQGVSFSHAESSYIHLALETGLAGLGLLVAGLLLIAFRLTRALKRSPDPTTVALLAAPLAGLAAGCAHAAADFIWYAPAIVVTTLMLIAIGLRMSASASPVRLWLPRPAWLAGAVGCLILTVAVQPELASRVTAERHWFSYLIAQFDAEHAAAEQHSAPLEEDSEESIGNAGDAPLTTGAHSTVAAYGAAAGDDSARRDRELEEMRSLSGRIRELMNSLQAQPQQPQASLHLAARCLDLFRLMQRRSENPLDLVNIRDTVLSSKFQSAAAMHAWLKRAFGGSTRLVVLADQMARKSLAACPTQHSPYELLLNTAFIRDPQDRQRPLLLDHAMRLGRFAPTVRYTAGFAMLADGRQEDAVEQWATVFRSTPEIRGAFCRRVGASTSVDFILTQFDPTPAELVEVLNEYAKFGRRTDIEKIVFDIARKTRPAGSDDSTQDGAKPNTAAGSEGGHEPYVPLLTSAARVAWDFGLTEQSEELLNIAMTCDPNAYWPRHALGLLLFDQARYPEAEAQFTWCAEQEPGDTKLEDLRRECRRLTNAASRQTRPASWQRSAGP
jgi:O-antigen ligase